MLRGGPGDDAFAGDKGNDSYGGTGDDYISGQGNNEIVGGPGQDRLISRGDSGDTVHIDAVDGEKDEINCADSEDTVEADVIDEFDPFGSDGRPECETVNVH